MDSKVYSLGAYRSALKGGFTPARAAAFSKNVASEMAADAADPPTVAPVTDEGPLDEPLAVTILRAFVAAEDVEKAAKAVAAVTEKPAEKGWFGAKYDKDMDIAEIAKRVRADIKAAFPSVKVSARISRYAGGRSLNVRITQLPKGMLPMNPQRVVFEAQNPHACLPNGMPRYNAAAEKLLTDVKAIVNAYRRDQSDIQTDYFSTNFYGDVDFSHELEQAHRHLIHEELAS